MVLKKITFIIYTLIVLEDICINKKTSWLKFHINIHKNLMKNILPKT